VQKSNTSTNTNITQCHSIHVARVSSGTNRRVTVPFRIQEHEKDKISGVWFGFGNTTFFDKIGKTF
jgi:hypothetical protein